MRRFFINKENIIKDTVIISGKEAHHLKDVIRLKAGDKFIGLDGSGYQYTCCVKKILNNKVEAHIEKKEKLEIKLPYIVLACAIPKRAKMDFIIEKASELGVSCLMPLETERTVVKLSAQKKQQRIERWRRIARESSKQCGRSNILQIADIMSFNEALQDLKACKLKLIACLSQKSKPIKQILAEQKQSRHLKSTAVLIGPEGDFTPEEIKLAENSGFVSVLLGPLILRVDTACLYVLSVLSYALS